MDPSCLALPLLLALVSAEAAGGGGVGLEAAAPVTVYTQFDQPYSDQSFAAMKAELAAIMTPIGIHFEWRSLATVRGDEVAVEVVVVKFKGKCRMNALVGPHVGFGALGWTHMSAGEVLPFSDLDCDRIRWLIGPLVKGSDEEHREVILGRAMGRVLAHELYHVFANTTNHALLGVAKAHYTASELVSGRIRFKAKECDSLRRGKLRTLVQTPLPREPAGAFAGGQ